MTEMIQTFKVTVEVLSPLHIGSGTTLQQGYDFVVHDDRMWRIDEDALFSATQSGEAAFDAALLGRPAEELLSPGDFKVGSNLFRYTMMGKPVAKSRGAEVSEQIKDVFDRAYLPGSSLKGALRTLLLWGTFKGAGEQPDLGRLGRNARQAGRPLEQAQFGRDPNHDWLRALRVRDSAPADAESASVDGSLMMANVRVYPTATSQRRRQAGSGLDIDVEAVAPGTTFTTEIALETYGFADPQAAKLGWRGQRKWIKALPRLARHHAAARLETEAGYFGRSGRPTGARAFYDDLIKRLLDLPGDTLLLQVGWGAGWESKTLGSELLRKDSRQFEGLLRDYRMTKQRHREPGDPFPISRHLALRQGHPALPMGWLQVQIEGLDAIEVTDAPPARAGEAAPARAGQGGGHLTGTVKRFVADRGFGFITPDDGVREVFFHISAVKGAARTLKEGDRIRYDVEEGPKGLRATNARLE